MLSQAKAFPPAGLTGDLAVAAVAASLENLAAVYAYNAGLLELRRLDLVGLRGNRLELQGELSNGLLSGLRDRVASWIRSRPGHVERASNRPDTSLHTLYYSATAGGTTRPPP